MFRMPLLVIYLIIALNVTMFTLVVQFDTLIFHTVIVQSLAVRIISWIFTIASWVLAYVKRDKYVTLF